MAKIFIRVDDGNHRQATWLELLFDLAFVICVSILTHGLVEHADAHGFWIYLGLFVPTWWIWNQFTWYASHFDNDDLGFRWMMLGGIFGTLFLASGLHEVENGSSDQLIFAYLFLHLLMGIGWVRAHRDVPEYRPYIRYKMTGLSLGLILWASALAFEDLQTRCVLWAIALFLQLSMPMLAWAKVKNMISVHQHHLLERHGLFVMILLGECLLVLSSRITEHHFSWMSPEVWASVLCLFGVWWIYFDWKYNPMNLTQVSNAFAFNYGHFIVYGSIGVLAAGIAMGEGGAPWIAGGVVGFLLALSGMNLLSHREKVRSRPWIQIAFAVALIVLLAIGIRGIPLMAASALSLMLIPVATRNFNLG